jgi:hypothetical protein
MGIKFFLLTLGSSLLVFLFLWRGNYPRPFRHRQGGNMFLAVLLSGLAIYFYADLSALTARWIDRFIRLFMTPPAAADYTPYFYCLLVILLFTLFKFARGIAFMLQKFFRWLRGKLTRRASRPEEGRPRLAYQLDEHSRIVLGNAWVFVRLFADRMALVVAVMVLLTILSISLVPFPFTMPVYPLLALMVVMEVSWFLNGPDPVYEETAIPGAEAAAVPEGDYAYLWEEYQRLWPDKLLGAFRLQSDYPPLIRRENILEIFKPDDDHSRELAADIGRLLNQGYELTIQDCHILKELYAYNDLIVANSTYYHLAPVVIKFLVHTVQGGHNVLIIIPYSNLHHSDFTRHFMEWTRRWIYRFVDGQRFRNLHFFHRGKPLDPYSTVVISTAEDLLEENVVNDRWFRDLRTVLFVSATEIFARALTASSILLNILKSRNRSLQCVVISDYRESLEPAVRRNLDIQKSLSEIRVLRDRTPCSHSLFWQLEGETPFQEKLLIGRIEKFLGAEAVLAVLPWRDRIEHIRLHGQKNVVWREYIEELENHKLSFQDTIMNQAILKSLAADRILNSPVSYLLNPEEQLVLLCRDEEYNLVLQLHKGNGYGQKETLLHIVSPPYVLRQYLLDNLEYFYRSPIYPLVARMMISRFSIALSLLKRLILIGLSETEILAEIHRLDPGTRNTCRQLQALFLQAFQIDIIRHNYLSIETRYVFNPGENDFSALRLFRLSPEIKKHIRLQWLRKIKVTNPYNNVLDQIYLDHLPQNYLPGQVHAFSGKPYRIENLDLSDGILRVNHASPRDIITYRPEMSVTLNAFHPPLLTEYRLNEHFNGWRVELLLSESDFAVNTGGYHFWEGMKRKYKALDSGVGQRHYPLGRVLRLDFESKRATGLDVGGISTTLVFLLKEVLLSLFPETHQYIVVCSSTMGKAAADYRFFFPQFKGKGIKKAGKKSVHLYLFEDSHQDLGLLQSIFDKWDYILKVMDDYIAWVLADPGQEAEAMKQAENQRDFPLSRKKAVDRSLYLGLDLGSGQNDFVDLPAAAAFLREIIGSNDLTTARQKFYSP